MPNEQRPKVQIEFTPEVKRNLRALAKKYRHIRSDIQPVLDRLESGEVIGDQIKCEYRTAIFAKASVPVIV